MKKQFLSLLTLVSIMLVCAIGANAQEVDYTYAIPSGTTSIDQNLINTIAESAKTAANADSYSATITIPEGEYAISSTITLPDGFSVNFIGAENTRPKLTIAKSIGIGGTHEFVRFENVELVDGGMQYLINQSTSTTTGELALINVKIDGLERSIVRTQGTEAIQIDNILIDGCQLSNLSSGNEYSVFYFKSTASELIGKLELKNSVFNTSKRSFVEASTAPITNGIVITNCTFYNNVVSGRYLIDNNTMVTNVTITNTILSKTFEDGAKGIRTGGTITIENCLRTADCVYAGNDIKALTADERTSEEIFADPANGDLTLTIDEKIGAPSGYKEIDYVLNIAEPHLYSLYLDYPATIPAGVTAYTGTLNTEETLLTLNEVEGGVIPANTAVVVEATTTGEYTFEKADEDVAEITNNSLKGVTEATAVTDLEAAEGKTVLTLGILNNVIGFRKPAGESILANRVYLPVTKTSEAKTIRISFGSETTGISEVTTIKAEADAPVYNLAGQRVAADSKGLLIKNGKKYIRK